MLNRILLKNFRKHRALEHTFDDGFSVVRGANEAGKSTIFEAVAYAIFGVGALRTPLDKTVTWGFPDNTLKVELDMTIDHTIYTVKRGKSGAEVTYAGGSVTGQKEVTKFLAGLMRMDINAAKRLVLSNQKEIAGALEAGPKATTEMIERLADFHQIDRLLDLMEQKLTLGSDANLKARLEAAQHQLATANDNVEPDWVKLESDIEAAAGTSAQCNKVLQTAQEAFDDAQAAHAKDAARQSERKVLADREERLQRRYSAAMADLQTLRANPVEAVVGGDEQIQALMTEKADLEAAARVTRIYEQVRGLCGKQDVDYFLGTRAELDQRMAKHTKTINESRNTVRESDHAIALLRKDLESGNCTFCGKDFSDLPEVQAKNSVITAKIATHAAAIGRAQADHTEAAPLLERLIRIQQLAKPYEEAAAKYPEYIAADTGCYPPILGWTRVDHVGPMSAEDLDAKIKSLRAHQVRHREYVAATKANDDLLESFGPEREDIIKRKAELGDADTADYAGALRAARDALQATRNTASMATTALNDAKGAQRDEQRRWDHALATVAAAQKVVDSSETELKALAFNNALQKKVRAARPVIADRLWNLVLTSVSTYFSEIRGVPSVVSKGADGFLIDNEPVESYSGSTIDSLGLAIRVALVRTFLPTAPFLILDEPAAACSAERTENMLGFILGSGFKQVLLVTHEDVSEGVADNIITLGETA